MHCGHQELTRDKIRGIISSQVGIPKSVAGTDL